MENIKILMVCLGNICRSPLAEGIMRDKLKQYNISGIVDSAGTASYHIGEPPDPRSIDIALKNGLDISNQMARAFSPSDFDNFDFIFAMDHENLNNILRQARSEKDREKVHLILDNIYPGSNVEVPDPYYSGREGFENVFKLLDESCSAIAQKLKN